MLAIDDLRAAIWHCELTLKYHSGLTSYLRPLSSEELLVWTLAIAIALGNYEGGAQCTEEPNLARMLTWKLCLETILKLFGGSTKQTQGTGHIVPR